MATAAAQEGPAGVPGVPVREWGAAPGALPIGGPSDGDGRGGWPPDDPRVRRRQNDAVSRLSRFAA